MKKLAAGVFVLNEYGELLAFHRNYDPKGLGFPCGLIDDNEDSKITAIRECFEETGFIVEINESIKPYEDSIVIIYSAKVVSISQPTHKNEGYHIWINPKQFLKQTSFKDNKDVINHFLNH